MKQFTAILLLFASTAAAQIGNYLGPGVLSRGAGSTGTRAGQEVSLRFGAGISGFYDTGITPIAVDSKGNLLNVDGQYGEEVTLTAYGVHRWRRALMGLDYSGNYRNYSQNTFYNGSDHMFALGYTFQKTQRLIFDARQTAGTTARGNSGFGGIASSNPDNIFDPNSTLLFDNRTYYLQSGLNTTYLLSPRTAFTAGGDGFFIRRQSKSLVGVNGYDLNGGISHRLSAITTIGATYTHTHYDFPRAFGESDINAFQGSWARSLGKRWTISMKAGVMLTEVQGVQNVALDPAVSAILGVSTGARAFYAKNTLPIGSATLTRQFKQASFNLNYQRGFNPGNGVYLTSNMENAGGSFSYTGLRKWSLSLAGGYNSMSALAATNGHYSSYVAGAGATYALTQALQIVTRYDVRRQTVDASGFYQPAYRVSIGLSFSPGDIPLSLW